LKSLASTITITVITKNGQSTINTKFLTMTELGLLAYSEVLLNLTA
jgi:hypothetical protein